MISNGVAVARGQVFVSGPRWSGSQGPAMARVDGQGHLLHYRDATWNSWHEGEDPRHAKGSLWAVNTGSPQFGGNPLPGGANLVQIDLRTAKVVLGPVVALPGSYVDDLRFHGNFTYASDAGRPGIIFVNVKTSTMRRVLNDIAATTAPADRRSRSTCSVSCVCCIP
jgi:hypothetical protein